MEAVGRNEPCPCGSGQKYKTCHLGKEEELTMPPAKKQIIWAVIIAVAVAVGVYAGMTKGFESGLGAAIGILCLGGMVVVFRQPPPPKDDDNDPAGMNFGR